MSTRHPMLDAVNLRYASPQALHQLIDNLVAEHEYAMPSIEDRCARAEALALIALELIRRMAQETTHD